MEPLPLEQFTVPEEDLRQQIGLSRATMRAQRHNYAEGMAWRIIGRGISWSPKGAADLRGSLGSQPEPETPPNGQPDATTEVLTVVSRPAANGLHCANRYVIKARRENGEQVGVRVSDPSKFTPVCHDGSPMTLRAQRGPYGWFLVGRGPRWTGRW